jgi:hypothetical protein
MTIMRWDKGGLDGGSDTRFNEAPGTWSPFLDVISGIETSMDDDGIDDERHIHSGKTQRLVQVAQFENGRTEVPFA